MAQLDFELPDSAKFPLLGLAYEALRVGGVSGCLLNAADEVAVEAFLCGRIPFLGIADIVEKILSHDAGYTASSVGELLDCDREARARARELVQHGATPSVAVV